VHGKPICGNLGNDLGMPFGIKTILPLVECAECLLNSIKQFKIEFVAPFVVTHPHRPLNACVLPPLSYLEWSRLFQYAQEQTAQSLNGNNWTEIGGVMAIFVAAVAGGRLILGGSWAAQFECLESALSTATGQHSIIQI